MLTLTDANQQVSLNIPGPFTTDEFQVATDASTQHRHNLDSALTLTWIGGNDDWNTASAWNLDTIPTSRDTAIIAQSGSNIITVGTTDNVGIAGLDTARRQHARGRRQPSRSGQLPMTPCSPSSAVTTLDTAPLNLGGTLAVQNGGTLTLGPSETITQTGPSATLDVLPCRRRRDHRQPGQHRRHHRHFSSSPSCH